MSDSTLLSLLTYRADYDGQFDPKTRATLEHLRGPARQALLAYPMKVGGTFMRSAMVYILEKRFNAIIDRGRFARSEEPIEMYYPAFLMQYLTQTTPPQMTIYHLHMYPTTTHTNLIDVLQIPVILASRNILDTLVSLYNMVLPSGVPEGGVNNLLSGGKLLENMSLEEIRHNLVVHATFWYAQYYVRWLDYCQNQENKGGPVPIWQTYDRLVSEPDQLLADMANHIDPEGQYSKKEAFLALSRLESVDDKTVRKNKAVSGRGAAFFTHAEKNAIEKAVRSTVPEDGIDRLGLL